MKVALTLIILIIAALCVLFGGWVTMLLWNWIMPYLFNLPEISIWMAVGINLLIGLLFKSKS